jgi:hypothetical protein
MNKLQLNKLLDFYDKRVIGSSGHASAINAVMGEDLAIALLIDYFSRKDHQAVLLSRKCTQGTRKGKRLDAWIEISNEDGAFQYQTEIKNWSAHAIGGRVSPEHETKESMVAYRINRWQNQFSVERRTLKDEAAKKVLVPMQSQSPDWRPRPLIVFWDAMHPTGLTQEFFSVEVLSEHFNKLWVFSMSTYVRNLISTGISELVVKMPDTVERLFWLDQLTGGFSCDP